MSQSKTEAELWLNQPKKELKIGYVNLRVRVPAVGYRKKGLGYKISALDWDFENNQVLKSHPEYRQINAKINRDRQALQDQLDELERQKVQLSAELAEMLLDPEKAAVVSGTDNNFIAFWKTHATHLRSLKKNENYCYQHEFECGVLADFAGEVLPFQSVNTSLLQRYIAKISPGIKPSTLYKKTKRLREVIKKAREMELISAKQLAGMTWPGDAAGDKEPITLKQLETIEKKLYSGAFDTNPNLRLVAAYFLVECTCGIRFSDWGRFRIEALLDEESLRVRAKKNQNYISLPLSKMPKLKKVVNFIKANDLTFNLTEKSANQLLKVIGGICEIPLNLTTHVGRHTFATLMLEKGFSKTFIAACMGVSERVVEVYAKMTGIGANNELKTKTGL